MLLQYKKENKKKEKLSNFGSFFFILMPVLKKQGDIIFRAIKCYQLVVSLMDYLGKECANMCDEITKVPFEMYIGWTYSEVAFPVMRIVAEDEYDALNKVINKMSRYTNCLSYDDDYVLLAGTTEFGRYRTREFSNFQAVEGYGSVPGRRDYIIYADITLNIYDIWAYANCHDYDEYNDLREFDNFEEELYSLSSDLDYEKYFPEFSPKRERKLSLQYQRLSNYIDNQDFMGTQFSLYY